MDCNETACRQLIRQISVELRAAFTIPGVEERRLKSWLRAVMYTLDLYFIFGELESPFDAASSYRRAIQRLLPELAAWHRRWFSVGAERNSREFARSLQALVRLIRLESATRPDIARAAGE
jgi:hypothetical protein